MIALQYCVGFCHIVTWIRHRYTNVPLPPANPSYPLGYYRVPNLSFVHHTVNFYRLSNFTYGSVYISIYSLNSPQSFFPSTNLFSMSVSPLLLYKEVHQYHLSRFHIYVLIYNIFPSFWLTSLCITASRFIYHTRTESNTFLFTAK